MGPVRGRPTAIVLALAVLLAAVGAGCTGGGLSPGVAARLIEGQTVLVAAGDGWRALSPGDEVAEGARVRTGLARARLELDRGELWLGESATVRFDGGSLRLERGEALLRDADQVAHWDNVTVRGRGTYRLSPGASPRIGVYHGEADLERPGERRRVPALRQTDLGTRRLPAEPDPLYYELDDPWDRALLPRAIAFDEEVASLARGIDREYGTAPQAPDFYTSFAAIQPATVPVLAATARMRDGGGAFGPPSDALITLFVAEAVARGHGIALAEAVERVAQRRAAGARWGLVALELDIEAADLAAAVDLARERRETVVPREPGPRRPGPPGEPSPGPDPRPSPRPTPRPTSSPSPSPTDDPSGVIQDTLEDIIGAPASGAGARARALRTAGGL